MNYPKIILPLLKISLLLFLLNRHLYALAPLRFAIQGDIHNFYRIPEEYLRNLLSDAKNIGCDFVAILGDILDGTKENPLRLSKSSPLPIIWQRGDHEFFSEWGRTTFLNLSERHPLIGEAPDPVVFFRGAIPRLEAMTGMPTMWAFIYRGILFVITHNGKNHVWHSWQLHWLEKVLSEHPNLTTIILSHRTLDEQGETAQALRNLLKKFPQVVLFCDAHIHSPHPFNLFGNALEVGVEADRSLNDKLTFQGNWYVVIELSPSGIRVFRREISSNKLTLLYQHLLPITLDDSNTGTMHLAFLMGDKGIRFNPAISLINAKVRVWGVEQQQLVPLSEKDNLGWRTTVPETLKVVPADRVWKSLGIEHILQASVETKEVDTPIGETEVPVHFEDDMRKVGIAGTSSPGTQYTVLVLARAPRGTRLRLEIDALLSNGKAESSHWVEGESDGGISVLQAEIAHIFLSPQNIRWEGINGKTEIDNMTKPRSAERLALRLKVHKNQNEKIVVQFIGFVFPESGGFFTPISGKHFTENIVLKLGKRRFSLGDISEGKYKEFFVGDLKSDEPIYLNCDGSKLALVELIGRAKGIKFHGLSTKLSEAFSFYGWSDDIDKPCIWLLKEKKWEIDQTRGNP